MRVQLPRRVPSPPQTLVWGILFRVADLSCRGCRTSGAALRRQSRLVNSRAAYHLPQTPFGNSVPRRGLELSGLPHFWCGSAAAKPPCQLPRRGPLKKICRRGLPRAWSGGEIQAKRLGRRKPTPPAGSDVAGTPDFPQRVSGRQRQTSGRNAGRFCPDGIWGLCTEFCLTSAGRKPILCNCATKTVIRRS